VSGGLRACGANPPYKLFSNESGIETQAETMHDTAQPPLSEKAQALLAKFPETVLLRPSGPLFIASLSLTVAFFSSLGWLFWFTAHEPNLPLDLFLMSYPLTVFCFAMDFVALWLLCDFMRGRMWLRLDVTGFQAFFGSNANKRIGRRLTIFP
jgi:hypothetical protein